MFEIDEILNAVDAAELYQADNKNTFPEISAVTTDTRTIPPDSLFLALKGERTDGHNYLTEAVSKGAIAICIDAKYAELEKIPEGVTVITVPDTLTAYQQIANLYRRKLQNLTVIGITGSCGKTSVKEILKNLLAAVYGEDAVYATEANNNNHIGVPLSLLSLKKEHRVAVIEMGSNHPGEIETIAKIAESDISIITNIARAHLEFFGDLNGVAEEKSAIFKAYGNALAPIDVFPEECPGNEILRKRAGETCYTFGEDVTADLTVSYLGGNAAGSRIKLSFGKRLNRDNSLSDMLVDWPLTGRHQALNASAALLALAALNPSVIREKSAEIADALRNCRLTGMRMLCSEINGITWINDAYNANPDSMHSALEWLAEFANSENSHIVLGDMLELGENSLELHKQILKSAVTLLPNANIYAVGPVMSSVANFAEIDFSPDAETVSAKLAKNVKKGDLVYLKASRGIALEKAQNQ